MHHPIFDRDSYPFERADADDLYERLVTAIPQPSQILIMYEQAGGALADVNQQQAPRFLWREVLNLLAPARRLQKLIAEVLATQLPGNEELHKARRAVIEAKPEFERRILGTISVLDRRPLRSLVATTLQPKSPLGVLIVRGDPDSGKSHSRHIFQSAASDYGADSLYLYEGTIANVDDVLWELFNALDALDAYAELETRPDTTMPAWYHRVCRKLLSVASGKGRRLWVAIDDLGPASDPDRTPLIDPEIAMFCEVFGLHLANPPFRSRFRLMLIHYPDGPVPTRWMRDVWAEDRTAEADVQQHDIEEYLSDWAAEQDRVLTAVETVAANVLKEVDGPSANPTIPRLQRISDKLAGLQREEQQGAS